MGTNWTPAAVELRIVAAFRALPRVGLSSMRSGELLTGGGSPSLVLDVLATAERVLGRRTREYRELVLWARSKTGGTPVRELCRANGWPRTSFSRRRARSLAEIAQELNHTA